MANVSQYFVNGLILRISDKSLLIQVDENKGNPPREDRLTDLPDWIFRSSRAIWLADSDAPLYRRAAAGEKIKQKLMSVLRIKVGECRL
ncbi:hypothetical protein L0152_30955 [bacterium]|nr:hypothetical protein [bacterium]